VSTKTTQRQGTAVSKDYQKKTARRRATSQDPDDRLVPVVPDVVAVAMNEIAADVSEGLLAIAVGGGSAGVDRDDGRRCDRVVRAARPA
jgi:hypothetical protein